MSRMRRLLALVAALVAACALAIVAAGCGEEDLPNVSAAEAAESTRDAGTARFELRFELSGLQSSQPVTVTAEGTGRTDAPDSEITIDVGEALKRLNISGDGDVRLLITGGRVFVAPPDAEGLEVPDGATWVTADLAAVAEAAGLDPVGLGELFRLTLEQQVGALQAAKSMKEVGEEEIDGVNTTHLRGTIRVSDYLKVLPPARRERAERAIREFERVTGARPGELDEPSEVDVWIDEDKRIRRMREKATLRAERGVPAGTFMYTVDVTDYGVELDIEAPPEDDVYDATGDLKKAIASGALGG